MNEMVAPQHADEDGEPAAAAGAKRKGPDEGKLEEAALLYCEGRHSK